MDENKKGNFFSRVLNRKQKRKFKNRAEVEGKSKKFYTTKQTHKRDNGKRVQKNRTTHK